jgi:hypothetical protein
LQGATLDVLAATLSSSINSTMVNLYSLETAVINVIGDSSPQLDKFSQIRKDHEKNWKRCEDFLSCCASFCSEVDALQNYNIATMKDVIGHLKSMLRKANEYAANAEDVYREAAESIASEELQGFHNILCTSDLEPPQRLRKSILQALW